MESDKTTYRCNAQTGHCRRRRRSGAEHRTATATRRRRAALQTKVANATFNKCLIGAFWTIVPGL
jgi:thiosulfate reductase cytochrome b subunit